MAYEGDTPIQALIEEDQQKNTNSKPHTEMLQVLEDSSEKKQVATSTPNEFVAQLDPKKLSALQQLNLEPKKLSASQQLNLEKIKDAYKNTTSLSILLIGKTGTGKSTIINGILGANIAGYGTQRAEVGPGLDSCTKEVTKYVTRQNDVDVTVWDSPGLQDGTGDEEEYLRQKCYERNVTVYCIKLSDGKFVRGDDNPDVRAMKKFTQMFGTDFWKTTVIVLTFANRLEAYNQEDWEGKSDEQKIQAFKEKIQEWTKQIKVILLHDVKVPEDIVGAIPIVPAGHKKSDLLGCDSWLAYLYLRCIMTIDKKQATLIANMPRVVNYISIGVIFGSPALALIFGSSTSKPCPPSPSTWRWCIDLVIKGTLRLIGFHYIKHIFRL